MGASSLAVRHYAPCDLDCLTACPLCGEPCPEPHDSTLRGTTAATWGDGDLLLGLDQQGCFVASWQGEALVYCPRHAPSQCREHAARALGFALPEVLR